MSEFMFSAQRPVEVERLDVCVAKYVRLRRLTRELLEEEVLRAFRLKVNVHSLDDAALDSIDTDWATRGRKVAFPWRERIMPVLHKSHPRRLDLALWCSGKLCGVAVARLSDAKHCVSITHIEGASDPSHSLKGFVVPIVLVGADIYATLVQAEDQNGRRPEVRIMNPLKESMGWYERCGYSVITQANRYSYATRFYGETP